MPVDQVTTADLVRVLLPIWHTKRETARKVKTRMSVVMRWAIAVSDCLLFAQPNINMFH